eukprot:TRINITY_DN1269_c0_g1_i1.p1 TRINITY_DN1269_c0_g1~~TRINITY_DN1269_c0_g1_i1.p1  ORF type:complete len:481 (+),score=102.01 TRINITY_DN1269_c0_g1_i1:88-1530(+)
MGVAAAVELPSLIENANEAELKLMIAAAREDCEARSQQLLELASSVSQAESTRRLRQIFQEVPKEQDGNISLQGLCGALKRDAELALEYGLPKVLNVDDEDSIARIFSDADVNADGSLDWDEFHSAMTMAHHELKERTTPKPRLNTLARQFIGLPKGSSDISEMLKEPMPIDDWCIDYWTLDERSQVLLPLHVARKWDCLTDIGFDINPKVFVNFTTAVKQNYRDVPYHNFIHAIAVVHFAFKLIQAAELQQDDSIDRRDLLALLLAALCHDCDHRGRNNAFEVLSLSSLALRYNDKSPLENHHCATAFQLALDSQKDTCNVFHGLSADDFRHIRRRMVSGILGTDMAFHHDQVTKLQKIQDRKSMVDCDDGQFVVEAFLHTADVANVLLSPAVSAKFSAAIAAEFTAQVDDEMKLGLPVTSFMCGLEDVKVNAKSRLGFMDFVVTPLVSPLFALYPSGLEKPQEYLRANKELEQQVLAS